LNNLIRGHKEQMHATFKDYSKIEQYRSRIARALGFGAGLDKMTGDLKVRENEQGVLQEILAMLDKTAGLQSQVAMSSLMYEDMSIIALSGEYDRKRHSATNF